MSDAGDGPSQAEASSSSSSTPSINTTHPTNASFSSTSSRHEHHVTTSSTPGEPPPPPPGSSSSSSTAMAPREGAWSAAVPTAFRGRAVAPRDGPPQGGVVWDDVAGRMYRELALLVNRLPFRQHLVVCIVFRGHRLRLDLGEVRAAGVACLIGLGLSLGSLLLYRLYFRVVVPFLQNVCRDAEGEPIDNDYTIYLEPQDSTVDEGEPKEESEMGNQQSKKPTPSVYYAPGYGVALGARQPSLHSPDDDLIKEEGLRLRPHRLQPRHKSPSPASDKDSAVGGIAGSEMSQSLYSDTSAMRDSFYSTATAESGFEEWYMEQSKRLETGVPGGLRGSLPQLYRAHHGADPGLNNLACSVKPGLDTLSDVSSERSGILSSCSQRGSGTASGSSRASQPHLTNLDPMVERLTGKSPRRSHPSDSTSRSSAERTRMSDQVNSSSHCGSSDPLGAARLSSCHSSPFRKRVVKPVMGQNSPSKQQFSPIRRANDNNQNFSSGCDMSQDYSESIRSLGSDEIDWDADVDDERMMVNLPEFQQSISDVQFQQSLMQRIQEWSTFAEEYNKSQEPSPQISPFRFVRRSRSLDRHLGDTSQILTSDCDLASPSYPKHLKEEKPVTEKHLETIEYELQDIQGEFESITSKLHELIENDNSKPAPKSSNTSPLHRRASLNSTTKLRIPSASNVLDSPVSLRKKRTTWHVPSSGASDCSRSSRASSVEFAWDFADYAHCLGNTSANTANSTADNSRADASADHVFKNDPEVINISLPVAICDYAAEEWKANTERACRIKEGYGRVPELLGCTRLARVRGDNYCGLRGALLQLLVQGHRASQGWGGVIPLMDALHSVFADTESGLQQWSFANRLPGHTADRLASLAKCALSLYATIEEVCNLPSLEQREKRSLGLFNSGSTFDLELMEGLKLLMFLKLRELQRRVEDGEDAPVFVHLLLARDTSADLRGFLLNHLNHVGDAGGLEQVEMCLLGYTLGVRVRVLRLAQCGRQDFDCFFPDDVPASWPSVSLIAEDDRHYNAPLP